MKYKWPQLVVCSECGSRWWRWIDIDEGCIQCRNCGLVADLA